MVAAAARRLERIRRGARARAAADAGPAPVDDDDRTRDHVAPPGASPLGVLRPGQRDPRLAPARRSRPARLHAQSPQLPARADEVARARAACAARVGEGAARVPGGARLGRQPHAPRRQPARDELSAGAAAPGRRAPSRVPLRRGARASPGSRSPSRATSTSASARSRTLLDVTRDGWGSSRDRRRASTTSSCETSPSPRARRRGRSSGASSAAPSCPITRPSIWWSNDVRGSPGALPRARAARVPERGHVRAARAPDRRRHRASSCGATSSAGAAARPTSTRCSPRGEGARRSSPS